MHKMWNFSTLQRPTQEEKERRRKYRAEKIQHANTLLPKSKVGRAKTFRERNNNEVSFEQLNVGPTSLPVSASMVEVLRHRAKSASRVEKDYYIDGASSQNTVKRNSKKDRDHSAHSGFVSRLRFLETSENQSQQRLRWQDREPSSGYSSGGRDGPRGQNHSNNNQELDQNSDDNIYGVKFASMPPEVSSRKG